MRADPGQQHRPAELRQIRHLGQGGADDDTHRPVTRGVHRGDIVDDRLRDGPLAGQRALHGRALGIGRGGQDEHAAAMRGRDVEQRLQRAEAQVRRGRHRIGGQRRLPRPRLRIGGHGRADVTALGVGQHQHTGLPQPRDGPFQHDEARRPVRLEERDLRLDDREARERLDADVAELRHAVGGHRQPPGGQELGVRVDAQAQRTPLCHGGPKPRAETHFSANWLCSSCSDRTPMSPRIPASMPCTAADAPCTVVTHGMLADTAAERIS
ncbi:Uncharacterised protein [Mycobacteroides abscessus subsp. abscessus]|nr:Uncharacterised protein [Mycobacteroides abscessus subsp. abscessus]